MTYSVYQHWDPLRVCVVGRSYPPEFYSWITKPGVRDLFERIAIETEEDYQNIITMLERFGVTVLRPDLPPFEATRYPNGTFLPPPMTPRDYMVMIGDQFYESYSFDIEHNYSNIQDPAWPDCKTIAQYHSLPAEIKGECSKTFHFDHYLRMASAYDKIFQHIGSQGNSIHSRVRSPVDINGAMISRVGMDLYFGTFDYTQNIHDITQFVDRQFPSYRNHVINTGGHSDGTYCPVCPGLIISLCDVPTYAETFPGWEVVYLAGQSWDQVRPFLKLKERNKGKWWIPGFEQDQDVIDVVETWLGQWVGYVEETVFDVNMLIIDPKNVMVFNHNQQVFDALDRHGITAHIVPFRHRYFWDGGIHCITADLHRDGVKQDYFPNRS
jgi:hypothetical protein